MFHYRKSSRKQFAYVLLELQSVVYETLCNSFDLFDNYETVDWFIAVCAMFTQQGILGR